MPNLFDILSRSIPKSKLAYVTRSFDMIGSIAIAEVKPEVRKYGKTIAKAIMQLHKNITTVAKKSSAMSGEYRVRRLKIIGGNKTTETVYRESGCLMKLDVSKVYFSVRLSHERERVAALVKNGENVLVMFAGVGPFALVIAKKNPAASVVGIELNPTATRYFQENIKLNKQKNCTAIKGDVRRIVPRKFKNFADRILMPLPKSAETFLDVAFKAAKSNAVIHLYNFGQEESVFEEVEKKISDAAKKAKIKVQILNEKVVRPYAPHIVQVCVDFKISR